MAKKKLTISLSRNKVKGELKKVKNYFKKWRKDEKITDYDDDIYGGSLPII